MLETLEQYDQSLFLWLNSCHSEILDFIMWQVSGKLQWVPLYLILLYLLYKKYGRSIWVIIIGAAAAVTLADQISVQLFKDVFERWRPCHNLDLKELVHTVNGKCGARFGFVSSHAANSFATASFIGLLLNKKILKYLLLWAILVAYSRVYLGVHYPGDIIGGAILGTAIGFFIYKGVGLGLKRINHV
ncbi:MAG: phosphatase PAP2 family protein [Flavobacteriales bacterium]|nr:phosphatase PAP2 family protein [Flavobacteriales bacterium]